MNIKVNGNEKHKSEIIYNNIVESMEEMQMSKEEQIEYLKSKLSSMESQLHFNTILICTIFLGLLGIGLGLYFVAVDSYLLGISLSFGTLAVMLYRIFLLFKRQIIGNKNTNFDKLDTIQKMLNSKLK